MNARTLVFGVSLVLNVVLIGAFALRPNDATPVEESPAQSNAPSPGSSAPAPEAEPENETLDTPALRTFSWESVESADYLTYIDNLRSIGCPEATIRDIITADVNKLYEQRWREIKQEQGKDKFEYWKSNAMFGGMSSDLRKAYREMDDERRSTLQSLLGTSVPRKITDLAAMYDPMENMLGFLPQSKRDAIMDIQTQMQESMMDAAEEGSNLDASDWQKIRESQKEKLAEVLTPEELLEYNLRMSDTANMLRSELGGFDVSEDEFREMYALREAFDEEYSPFGFSDLQGEEAQDYYRERSEAEKDLRASYESVLGEDRYSDYQHEQTLRGSSLRNVAKEFDIPREDVYQVFDATDAAQEAANAVRTDQALSDAQRQAALDQIRAETEAEVARLIGDEAAQQYIDGGSRIRNLSNNNVGSTTELAVPVSSSTVIYSTSP